MLLRTLEHNERITFRLHLIYSILDGFALGVIALNEFVLLKAMKATAFQIGLFWQLSVLVMPFSIFLNQWLDRAKHKKRLLRRAAIFSRTPLLLFLFFPQHLYLQPQNNLLIWFFLILFFLYYIGNPLIWPALNLFTKANYKPERFGKLFGWNLTATQITTVAATFIFGMLLNWNPDSYRWVFPVIGILSLTGIWMMIRIPIPETIENPGQSGTFSLKQTLNDSFGVFKENPAFGRFQMAMMAYGMGFLMSLAIVTVYLGNHFKLDYNGAALYKNIPVFMGIMLFPVLSGHMDKRDPRRLAIFSFLGHGLFFLGLILADFYGAETSAFGYRIIYMLLLAYLCQGIYVTLMGLVWGIGSSYFAPAHEAARYHSVHITLTGIRGIIAPPIGVLLYNLRGFNLTFSICLCFEALAIYIMWRSIKKYPALHAKAP
jgi:MFS family permease